MNPVVQKYFSEQNQKIAKERWAKVSAKKRKAIMARVRKNRLKHSK